jgi:hypothetical protein
MAADRARPNKMTISAGVAFISSSNTKTPLRKYANATTMAASIQTYAAMAKSMAE